MTETCVKIPFCDLHDRYLNNLIESDYQLYCDLSTGVKCMYLITDEEGNELRKEIMSPVKATAVTSSIGDITMSGNGITLQKAWRLSDLKEIFLQVTIVNGVVTYTDADDPTLSGDLNWFSQNYSCECLTDCLNTTICESAETKLTYADLLAMVIASGDTVNGVAPTEVVGLVVGVERSGTILDGKKSSSSKVVVDFKSNEIVVQNGGTFPFTNEGQSIDPICATISAGSIAHLAIEYR